jgi:tRNA(adenine34) deaminase
MRPTSLEGAWRECFELAWEAFRAGTIPVGAVVADSMGTIVAHGRNRIFEATAPPGQLAGTYIAHAELNALAGLPSIPSRDGNGPYAGHTLYTTLEPCALCVGAALMIMIGEVRYASRDHYGGGATLQLENPHTARLPLALAGPLDGPLGDLGELLHLAHFLWRKPASHVLAAYRKQRPDLVGIGERLDLMTAALDGATVDDALALLERARS